MTGVQTASTGSDQASSAGQVELSNSWTEIEEVRAAARGIPAAKRQEAIRALHALILCNTTDTMTGAFNA